MQGFSPRKDAGQCTPYVHRPRKNLNLRPTWITRAPKPVARRQTAEPGSESSFLTGQDSSHWLLAHGIRGIEMADSQLGLKGVVSPEEPQVWQTGTSNCSVLREFQPYASRKWDIWAEHLPRGEFSLNSAQAWLRRTRGETNPGSCRNQGQSDLLRDTCLH